MNNHHIYNKVYLSILLFILFSRIHAQEYEWHITRFTEEEGFSQCMVAKVVQDSIGYIWLASWDGLLRYDGYRFKVYKARPGDGQPLSSNRMDDIGFAPEGGLYCRSGRNYYHFRDGLFTPIPDSVYIFDSSRLPNKKIRLEIQALPQYRNEDARVLHADNQGGIWVRSGRGLERLYRRRKSVDTRVYNNRENGRNFFRALYEDNKGRVWMTDKSGFVRIAPSRLSDDICFLKANGEISPIPVPFGYKVYSILQDRKGRIWMGCKPGGLFCLRPEGNKFSVRHFMHNPSDPYSLSSDEVYSLSEDAEGRIWIGTYGGGLNLIEETEKGNVRFYHSGNDMVNYPSEAGYARCLYNLSCGVLLIGTSDGLCLCRNSSNSSSDKLLFELFQRDPEKAESLSSSWIMDITEANDSTLYIATYGGGLNSVNIRELLDGRPRFSCYGAENGLPSDIILAMVKDYEGNIWCSSEMALACFNPYTKASTNFMRSFLGEGFSFSESALLGLKDSVLVAGTSQGILMFHPEEMRRSDFVPPLVFDCPQEIFLKPEEKNLAVHFAALDYNKNETIRYAYRFDNSSSDWIYTKENAINLTNIPAGTSTLRVRSTNSDGNWVDNEQTIIIHRTPHFNELQFAWMLYGVLIVAFIGGIVNVFRYIRLLKKELNDIRLSTGETIEYLTTKLQETLSKEQGNNKLGIPKIENLENDNELFRKKVNNFIENNVSNPDLSIDDFAREMGVSRSNLYLQMKQLYGCTPNNYLQQVRIEMAKNMLEAGYTNVSDIAYRCGFSDPKYFSRLFKKIVGMTPSEYMGK